ncbi:MAG: fasciclin domain-containing protein [Phycisphaeraceae bacterium]
MSQNPGDLMKRDLMERRCVGGRLVAGALVLGVGLAGAGLLMGTGSVAFGDHHHQAQAGAADEVVERDLVEVAVATGKFSKLVNAVIAAGLADALKGEGPLTVFAPTDAAFEALGSEAYEALLRPENREKLVAVLTYHVVSGRVLAGDLRDDRSYETLNGAGVRVDLDGEGGPRVNASRIVVTDVAARNGVIHVIDRVLLPPDPSMTGFNGAAAIRVIDAAVSRGVPLFNDGEEEACRAVYEVAVIGLLALGDDVVPESIKKDLKTTLAAAGAMRDAEDAVWRLRSGLDTARALLASSAGRMVSGPEDLGDGRVRFVLEGFADAKRVSVTGAWKDWDPLGDAMKREGDRWVLELRLGQGRHAYKFVVDGEWVLDPGNPATTLDDAGFENSVLLLTR